MSLFHFALTNGIKSKNVQPEACYFGDFEMLYLSHEVRQSKDGRGFIFATFTDRQRLDANVDRVTAIALDIDSKEGQAAPPPFDEAVERLKGLGVAACAWTTYSHTTESPRYRVVCPLAEPMQKDALPIAQAMLADTLGLTHDPACKNPGRIYFTPACPPERADIARAWACTDAMPLSTEQFERRVRMEAALKAAMKPTKPRKMPAGANADALIKRAASAIREASERNVALNRWGFIVGKVATQGGVDIAQAEAVLMDAALSAGLPPREVAYTLRRSLREGGAK